MSQFHSLTVSDLRRETRDSVSLAFAVPAELADTYRFTQGQYLTLRTEIEGEDVRRSYSICTGVNDGELRVAVKKVPGGLFSTFANEQLQSGAQLQVMPPMGSFYTELNPERAGHYLLVAAGSGITPILSIVKSTLEVEPHSTVTVIYGNRSSSSAMFREALENLKNTWMGRLNLIYVFSREQQDIDLYNGHIDADKCRTLFSRWIDTRTLDAAFICGPEAMTETVRDTLKECGLAADKIHFELFASVGNERKREQRADAAASGTGISEITVIRDGHSKIFDLAQNTTNLLEAGNEHGAELPFSCKAGVCSTCKCKVIEGEVDMDVSVGLEEYEVKAGYVLSCQSYPLSRRVVLDFDEV
ncbi:MULTISPECIES: 1,2-phenylacetyl-CoA epoxidase subunit PaaE [unclassified Oceanobacter]|uniref:1,2-phenylacetyl-CoA epoxidase subunit PaaE n=1 Tax=unclassified Oceanobacter TaxID=2620260 RepID=UPI002734DFBC|nr:MULTISPECIES: 1,2-phenylacetyl-CoA epoxidase subunit PaaE [unclassified Oceanobacter]MDP2549296.1 1,2-phenylacetyl-CoA epoxidase subunit PaaE [Oceanobacter sp. 4_MG-2023]MDP2609070.1 1,2-phenylacetyl-CoA epoxidase subunit PaaE [Oceanobacter sp. 1_MG-2023]MDP2612392.1 1,2-phenylacetyl-CoA epoxidase subunit PaaE [Oceanobacter sp. 2_MG-2023]